MDSVRGRNRSLRPPAARCDALRGPSFNQGTIWVSFILGQKFKFRITFWPAPLGPALAAGRRRWSTWVERCEVEVPEGSQGTVHCLPWPPGRPGTFPRPYRGSVRQCTGRSGQCTFLVRMCTNSLHNVSGIDPPDHLQLSLEWALPISLGG